MEPTQEQNTRQENPEESPNYFDSLRNSLEYVERQFSDFPQKKNQTWSEHCLLSLRKSFLSFTAGGAYFIHGLFPFVLQETGDETIKHILVEEPVEHPLQ